jgi:hypothetical protein
MQVLLLRVKITKAIHRCLLGQQETGYKTFEILYLCRILLYLWRILLTVVENKHRVIHMCFCVRACVCVRVTDLGLGRPTCVDNRDQ